MLIDYTPLQETIIQGRKVLIKREDMCCPFPGPGFSKIRGVYAHMKNRPEPYIGVLDTLHSKAGWAVAYVGKKLGKKVVNFWPLYKKDEQLLARFPRVQFPRIQQQHSAKLGSFMVSLPAGRSSVLYHSAKKYLRGYRPGDPTYMMPNALKLPESITENAKEVIRCRDSWPEEATLIISISSGTVAAGVLKGFQQLGLLKNYKVILHMGYSRSKESCYRYISEMSEIPDLQVTFIDEGYEYADRVRDERVPKFCNPYYDAKAYKWMLDSPEFASLPGQIIFWNIGE